MPVPVTEGLKILLCKNPDFRAFSSFSHANLTTLEWVLKVMYGLILSPVQRAKRNYKMIFFEIPPISGLRRVFWKSKIEV